MSQPEKELRRKDLGLKTLKDFEEVITEEGRIIFKSVSFDDLRENARNWIKYQTWHIKREKDEKEKIHRDGAKCWVKHFFNIED